VVYTVHGRKDFRSIGGRAVIAFHPRVRAIRERKRVNFVEVETH